jgi:ligand-binding sensor domain-containing protein
MRNPFLLAAAAVLLTGAVRGAEWATLSEGRNGLSSNSVRALLIDSYGGVWIGTDAGLDRWDGAVLRHYAPAGLPAGMRINDLAVEEFAAGWRLWAAGTHGVWSFGFGADANPTMEDFYGSPGVPLPAETVNAAAVDVFSVKWFGTDLGAASLRSGGWAVYTRENYWIQNNRVKCIATDADGMNYLGTEGAGVSRLRMDPVDGITSASAIDWAWSGLVSDTVYSILIRQNGHQWYGTDKGACLHTSRNTREDWTVYTTADGLAGNVIQALAEDAEGLVWFGTSSGLSRFDGARWRNYTSADGLAGDDVRDIAVAGDGTLWFATNAGVSHAAGLSSAPRRETSSGPAGFGLVGYPNPFNSSTALEFTLPGRMPARVSIVDLGGKPVRILAHGVLEAGSHRLEWDGLDNAGRAPASGVYLAVVAGEGFSARCKLMLIR